MILVIAKYMTFKDLQKLVQTQSDPECQLLQRLKDKPFWIARKSTSKKISKRKAIVVLIISLSCQRKIINRNQSLIMRSYSMNLFLFGLSQFAKPYVQTQPSMGQEGNWFRGYSVLSQIYGMVMYP